MARMKRVRDAEWTTAVPLLAVVALALTWGSKPATVVVVLVGAVPRRRGARRGPPRRGGRAPRRRAVRLARARRRGDGDRGRADRDADGLGRRGHRDARARHRVRRGDDHHERHPRPLAADRRAAARRRDVQRRGHGAALATVADAGHAQPRPADVHHERARARSSRSRSSRSPPSPRSRSTGCSSSSRPSATATTSCPVELAAADRRRPRRAAVGPRRRS